MAEDFRVAPLKTDAFTAAQFTASSEQTTDAINVRQYKVKTVLVYVTQGSELAAPDDVTVDVLVKIGREFVPLATAIGGAASPETVFPFTFFDAIGELKVRLTAGAVVPGLCTVVVNGGNGGN